jgi:hypothetical protein
MTIGPEPMIKTDLIELSFGSLVRFLDFLDG